MSCTCPRMAIHLDGLQCEPTPEAFRPTFGYILFRTSCIVMGSRSKAPAMRVVWCGERALCFRSTGTQLGRGRIPSDKQMKHLYVPPPPNAYTVILVSKIP